MNVLHVYKDYWPVVGGIENHIKRLAIGLNKEPGLDVQVLVTSLDRVTHYETIDGIHVTKAGRLGKLASAPISFELFREIGKHRFDIIHLHFPYPIGELAYLLCGRSKKVVVTYHSDIVRQKRLARVYRPFLELLLRRADAICVSNAPYAQTSPFLRRFPSKVHVIHHGLDVERFEPTEDTKREAERLRSEVGAPFILFVGELRYYKGLEILLAALVELDSRLLIVGGGPEEQRLKEMARNLGLSEKVIFAGRVSDKQLVAAYHAAQAFVLPSTVRAESWGAVLLEAMACGLPLVTTELGTGTSFINVDNVTGRVVPPGDPHVLAGALRDILTDDRLRKEYGSAATKRVREQFSAARMVDETRSLYERVLSNARI